MSLLQRVLEMVEEDSAPSVDLVDQANRAKIPKSKKSTTEAPLKNNKLKI